MEESKLWTGRFATDAMYVYHALRKEDEEAKYYKEEVRKELSNLFGSEKLYSQGYIVKTTIDTTLQKIADKVFINGLIKFDKKNGWRGPIQNSNYKEQENTVYSSVLKPYQ